MFADNALGYAQPQAGAFALALGGKKGIKDGTQDVPRYAAAEIDNFHRQVMGVIRRHNDDLDLASFGRSIDGV